MPDTAFGQTGLRPSALAFGCNHIALNRGRGRRREAEAALAEAHEAGINFFDIADVYGRGESERMLGRVLGRHRDRDHYLLEGRFHLSRRPPPHPMDPAPDPARHQTIEVRSPGGGDGSTALHAKAAIDFALGS